MDLRPEGRKRLARLMGKGEPLTYREVAEAAGFKAHSFVQKLLTGERKGMDPEHAFALARFLDVPVEWLFDVSFPNGREPHKADADH